ncbi:lateral flagellin LafA [Stutzerimonas stutzeri]|uniref:lateral flagellin LafA n=1 Tax=Stutzerimonas stutzeri TaxID=316 RepID=UPI000F79D569|nr:lateral flagellin LafA [Stutzerimonas stutzeri]RRW55970.1 Lateral flagellin [Stutzerimonas stutzeri]
MALSIHTNYSSLVTQTNLSKTNNALGSNQQRLGTGLRINSAADDAAGLQIATRLNAQSRGMGVAMRNTNDAVSLLQTAEGAFNEATDILQRMKDLSTQAANDTNSADDRKALQAEFDELGKELKNIIDNTSYAGEKLFSAADAGATPPVAAGKLAATGGIKFQIGASAAETLSLDVSTQVTALVTALNGVSATFADPTASGTELTGDATATPVVTGQAAANASITKLADTLNNVGELRAQFGANINRLNHTNNNLANMKDNTEMAKGRIMDADFASESANMTKNSMLMQSGISMLKQAGQMPSMVMGLLG